MLRVNLSKEEQDELESFRKHASSKDSEKALIILLSNDGKTVPEIAQTLKRNPHTIRDWLKRYMKKGIKGLNRNFSPGRPATARIKIQRHIQKIIADSPSDHGYQDRMWSVPLITFEINKTLKLDTSTKTVTRALKDMGYVYKRPSKAVPGHAPSKEEKRIAVQAMVQKIIEIIDLDNSVIYALDESHFSTEPYLVQGWFKKRWPPSNSDPQKERKPHLLWMLESENTKILLEEVEEIRQ